jgi:RNA polymerase sigma factor (sigma-70 family)
MSRNVAQLASRLRRETATCDPADTDRDLLARFLREQDEAAFEALIRRHERLVRSAIAKVLSDPHDAEDTFQATFLILVRRAKLIDWHAGFGPWLYGVAHRVAVKARDAGRARVRKEQEAGTRPAEAEQTPDLSWREACALLHAELDKLPDRYRLPLLLCYLEGKSRDEAAAALKVTVGTVKGRLERGRDMLRDRLARRGVTLSAGLLAALAATHTCASSLASVSAVLEVVRGSASARVLALTREVAVSTILAKLTKTVACVIALAAVASAMLSAGAARPTDAPEEKTKAPAAIPTAKPDDEKKDAPKPVSFVIPVVVKKPNGTPAAGANVSVWADRKKQVAGKADEKGRLDLMVPTFFPKVVVIATAPGFAPDWAEFSPVFVGKQLVGPPTELALRDEGPALEGRVTDLEGRPVANLPVDVERVGRPKLGKTLDEHIKLEGRPYFDDLDSISATAAGLPTRVTTDKDGKFTIAGAGRDRSVRLATRGDSMEHTQVRVVTRDIDPKLARPGPYGLHGRTFTLQLAPSRPIVGTVRDTKTGEPVPGMKVVDAADYSLRQTTTDKDGKYRLVGLKKEKSYRLAVGSLGEAPYFDANVEIDDTPGLDPIPQDIKLHRGTVMTGRVTDSAGKPVSGFAFYDWGLDNPYLKDFPGIQDAVFLLSPWARAELDREGRYKLLVIPGPATIGVCASPEGAFTRINRRKVAKDRPNRLPHDPIHTFANVNIDPKNPKTLTHDFTLSIGKARALVIRGVDGKLPAKLLAVWQTESPEPKPVAGDTLKMTGLSAKGARAVVLIDEAKTVGAVAAVTGDAETPVTVALEKLGSVSGRVLDADGKPAAGAGVRLWLILDRNKYENLPSEYSESFGVEPSAWQEFTGRTTKTDKDGRFTLTGLLPGQEYRLATGFDLEKPQDELLHVRTGVTVKPDEKNDLGDLKPKK